MAGWSDRLTRFMSHRRRPYFELSLRRVFVLPTRHGFMVALAIFGVFAIAIRIQNNMLLLMAVALFVLFMLSLLWAGQNLQGLRLTVRHDGRMVAGETGVLSLQLASEKPVYDIGIDTGAGARPAMQASYTADHLLTFTPSARGRQSLPLVRLETRFPFGLARAWGWISPAEVLVAPQPDFAMARLLISAGTSHGMAAGGAAEGADSLRDWMSGTPESRISWKRYAATDRLLEKTGDTDGDAVPMISYAAVAHLGHEAALSAMCGAVLRAARAGRSFDFQLGDIRLRQVRPQAAGGALDALALA